MITLDPVALTGNVQNVDLVSTDACCVLIDNESPYGLRVRTNSARERWLPAWTADLFDVAPGTQYITLTPDPVGSLVGAPSTVALISVSESGDGGFPGVYPVALARQAGLSSGQTQIVASIVGTIQAQLLANAGGLLGDVSLGTPAADAGTETITTAGGLSSLTAAIASFKPTTAGVAALIQAAAVVVGTNTAVNPAWVQPPVAGSLLLAAVTTYSVPAATATPGWALVVDSNPGGGGRHVSIFAKPNAAGGDVAPAFTCVAGSQLMMASLAEFSGLQAAPNDQTGGIFIASPPNTTTAVATAVDTATGELVVLAANARNGGAPMTCAFAETFNNGAAATHMIDNGATMGNDHLGWGFAIMPVTAGLPLGARAWDFDATGTHTPAAGNQATVTLAAVAGKRYRAAALSAGVVQETGAAFAAYAEVLDGATAKWRRILGLTATAGDKSGFDLSGLAIVGTVGQSMTFQISIGQAGIGESVSIGAYLEP